jgi:hypothetical protein
MRYIVSLLLSGGLLLGLTVSTLAQGRQEHGELTAPLAQQLHTLLQADNVLGTPLDFAGLQIIPTQRRRLNSIAPAARRKEGCQCPLECCRQCPSIQNISKRGNLLLQGEPDNTMRWTMTMLISNRTQEQELLLQQVIKSQTTAVYKPRHDGSEQDLLLHAVENALSKARQKAP